MSSIKETISKVKNTLLNVEKVREWITKEIKKLTEGKITISEDFINDCLGEFAPNHSVEVRDGCLVHRAEDLIPVAKKIEIACAYHACDFRKEAKAVTIKLLDIKPFYLKPALLALPIKYPFIKTSRDAENTRLITCHLNEIPSLRNNKILNSPFLKYLTIQYLKCEVGKVTIKLGIAGTLKDIINDAGKLYKVLL
ncbi:MAG: hypothetical protein E3K37_00020 [Candidatus Kuenenia sp.]|nr:hypothetical protein [Candidatus Kuenenia hertensis]